MKNSLNMEQAQQIDLIQAQLLDLSTNLERLHMMMYDPSRRDEDIAIQLVISAAALRGLASDLRQMEKESQIPA